MSNSKMFPNQVLFPLLSNGLFSKTVYFLVNCIKAKPYKLVVYAPLLVLILSLTACENNEAPSELQQQLAQKIMLDLRYYCPEMTSKDKIDEPYPCKTPMTKLPAEISEMIAETSLGAVILFSENLVESEQIIQLTSDLTNAALKSNLAQPLLISVDQEGGRVARLPRTMATTFTGNMSIGATHKVHGNRYASSVGQVLGAELKALGINVNHAPTVDVNINPDNPVINVRSFSDDPVLVGELGIAMLQGIQSQGVIGTLKHFPGHGDTNVDSHTGLPVVNHDLATVKRVDLLPFQVAIDQGVVDMIMTAHIQYPALDNSVLINKFGQSMLKPATLSNAILTGLLREKMGYKGVIVTDALDMAGISHFFTPLEAVSQTFSAGADIAMMPMKIRMPDDIKQFKEFLALLANRVSEDSVAFQQMNTSLKRIAKLKQKLPKQVLLKADIDKKIRVANGILANKTSRQLELSLARSAIVELKKEMDHLLLTEDVSNVHIVFPKSTQSEAMAISLQKQLRNSNSKKWQISIANLENYSAVDFYKKINASDLVIVGSESQKTAVDLGGVEDLTSNNKERVSFGDIAFKALNYSKNQNKKTIFVTLKTPYQLAGFEQVSDWILASFDGNSYIDNATGELKSPAFDALAEIITGKQEVEGNLPIRL